MSEKRYYYTPEIEEFHVGFEYQLLEDDTNNWEDYTIEDKHDLFDALNETTRVKLLDKDDALSLGWKPDQFTKEDFALNFEDEEWYMNIFPASSIPGSICLVEIGRDGYDTGYFGEVKNKSELKFIMKRLGMKTNLPDNHIVNDNTEK